MPRSFSSNSYVDNLIVQASEQMGFVSDNRYDEYFTFS